MERQPRIGIIGAGVNGIGSALAILKAFPRLEVTVYSDYFTPYTTGDVSAGFWTPFSSDTPPETMNKWSKITFDLFETWWKERKTGVLQLPVRFFGTVGIPTPEWSHIPPDFRDLTQEELKCYGPGYISGYTYTSYIAEPSAYIPEMMDAIKSLGGKFEMRSIGKLEDISHKADIIINCAGIGSRDLVPDPLVYPARGQIMRVHAPWVKCISFDLSPENFGYIIPNQESVILGGTIQDNDWRITIDLNDSKRIWRNCNKIDPTLKHAKVLRESAGLRPSRKGGIRLEEEIIFANSKRIPVIHNYGHGGSGATTFWGCSLDVRNMLEKIIDKYYAPIYSKL